ncbi:SGNH/GDSL hydrolase family protein [Aquimarina agarilytica]|uniref:SGNH/GDSL hydrolase family protein n=1 Tax=Aquimarina agarilytica TaxID=1087449 RepID=UPI00028993F6|nr:SGNH/GDSL hydrolase family protein [Aquimarina agarilytica]
MKNYIKYISILSLALVACEPEFDNEVTGTPAPQSSGEANFSTYVALGNSLTAGFADQTLYIDGQKVAFPVLIAEQMKAAGGGEFTVPFMADNVGGFPNIPERDPLTCDPIPGTLLAPPRLVFNLQTGLPETIEGESSAKSLERLEGTFNNMGVPGARSFHLVTPGYGTLNPFFGRFASSDETTVIADALAQQPTFFSLWIGNNDILGYATNGGIGTNQQGNRDAASYKPADLSDTQLVSDIYGQLIQNLTANGAKGLLMNIPDVQTLPFFTRIPNNALVLDAEQAANLTGFFRAYTAIVSGGAQLMGTPQAQADALASQYAFTFNPGPNRFIVSTPTTLTNPMGIRQISEDELILLTIDQNALRTEFYGSVAATPEVVTILGKLATGGLPTAAESATIFNAVKPIENKDYLSNSEIAEIETATTAINTSIKAIADANDLAFYDANARLKVLSTTGVNVNGSIVTSAIGNFFSLDGVHLSPRGNAVIANEMMETINAKYGSTLQPVASGAFPTVRLK